METKKDNNLVKITLDCNGEAFYFTTANKAGEFIGKQKYNIMKALKTDGRVEFSDIGPMKVELVDGSNVCWKHINNVR
jgi:hypothetical protein